MVNSLKHGIAVIVVPIAFLLLSANSYAATTFMIESTEIVQGTTSLTLDFSIVDVDPSDNIDSMTFDLDLSDGLVLTDVAFINVPSGWQQGFNLSNNRFGATDYGWPANALESDLVPFVELYFEIDPLLAETENSFVIDFAFSEIVDSNFSPLDLSSDALVAGEITVVPIPSAILLLCSGLFGIFAIRRNKKKE
jgi:hypothetical protein